MSNDDIEWRYIWKECVDAGQKSILLKDSKLENFFPQLYKDYGDDKMITFEKAITLECLGQLEAAKELYKQSSDEKDGLPVEHWKKRARYFFERNTPKLINYTEYFQKQWNVYYNMHTYSFLHPHIRYLAISSVSRVNNEPEMAVVIFRTCLDICVELYWSLSYEKKNYHLGDKVKEIFFGKVDNKIEEALKLIIEEGNLAAHPFKKTKFEKGQNQEKRNKPPKTNRTKEKPFKYNNKDISNILDAFDIVMKHCNSQAEKIGKSILCKDLEILF